MTEPGQVSPSTARGLKIIVRWIVRLASIGFGVAIEAQEVYGTETAQWPLVFLGLWFIGVPPALWFDGVWRLARIASYIDEQAPARHSSSPEEPTEQPPPEPKGDPPP